MIKMIIICVICIVILLFIVQLINNHPILRFICGILLGILFFYIGKYFPDIDLILTAIPYLKPFLGILGLVHRSWLTHSALIVLIAYWISRILPPKVGFLCVIGATIGICIHLGLDMNPSKWQGTAYITFPFFIGKIPFVGMIASLLWLGGNICLSIYFAYLTFKDTAWNFKIKS